MMWNKLERCSNVLQRCVIGDVSKQICNICKLKREDRRDMKCHANLPLAMVVISSNQVLCYVRKKREEEKDTSSTSLFRY